MCKIILHFTKFCLISDLAFLDVGMELFYPEICFIFIPNHANYNTVQKSFWLIIAGAYGAAVLYRKKDDGSQVILKEINLMDLTKTERYSAMNEAQILSRLDHPNIISYYDNFEEDGVLMIEMEYADGG